jgi:1-acyl-sn-glycerol-3-phosphate acyltransferase
MTRQQEVEKRSLAKRWFYSVLYFTSFLGGVVLFRLRFRGRQHIPREGGVLVCANHQSVMDPVLVGLATPRRLNYLARRTLFGKGPFSWLISFLDAIPIDRDGMGLEGLKETLRRLRRGEMVLIFPEGTRSPDGELQPLKPGFYAVARRSGAALLPVALDGAFQAWPRGSKWPRLARIGIEFGPPLWPDQIAAMTQEQLLEELQRRLAACHAGARRLRTPRGLVDGSRDTWLPADLGHPAPERGAE